MMNGAASSSNGLGALDQWSARRIRPIVMLYVVAVFAIFCAVAYFVVHSTEAVKALVVAAVAALGATVPGVMEKIEYRLGASGIEKRTVRTNEPREFESVFRWDELSHVSPMRHGFKYSKTMTETNALRRFWNTHLSDRFSGEVHVEKNDLKRVLEIVERQGVAIS